MDGSSATIVATSYMPFQVSASSIATVPETVLMTPFRMPTSKSE